MVEAAVPDFLAHGLGEQFCFSDAFVPTAWHQMGLCSRMMVMACETRLRMVAYWKPPTSERRGRRDFAEDAKNKKIHRLSSRPLRILGVLCVWLFIFLMGRAAMRH
jgi:hypothetical protein